MVQNKGFEIEGSQLKLCMYKILSLEWPVEWKSREKSSLSELLPKDLSLTSSHLLRLQEDIRCFWRKVDLKNPVLCHSTFFFLLKCKPMKAWKGIFALSQSSCSLQVLPNSEELASGCFPLQRQRHDSGLCSLIILGISELASV